MTETSEILQERAQTHGSFEMNARFSQDLKRLMHAMPCWNGLHDVHKEALHMIALKLSRIMSGQADYADHWTDCSGYSKLAEKHCKK